MLQVVILGAVCFSATFISEEGERDDFSGDLGGKQVQLQQRELHG